MDNNKVNCFFNKNKKKCVGEPKNVCGVDNI